MDTAPVGFECDTTMQHNKPVELMWVWSDNCWRLAITYKDEKKVHLVEIHHKGTEWVSNVIVGPVAGTIEAQPDCQPIFLPEGRLKGKQK